MPFIKGLNVDGIENVTVMINRNIEIRHGYFPDNKIHICFADHDKVKDDCLVDFEDGTGLAMSDKCSHIDFILDTDREHLQQLINALQRIHDNDF